MINWSWFRYSCFSFYKSYFWMTIPNWNLLRQVSSKEECKGVFSNICHFKVSFLFNTIITSTFLIPLAPICISFFINWIWIKIQFNRIWIAFIVFYFILIKFKFNSIQFNSSCTSFNIVIGIELNFHKINSFFPSIDHHHSSVQ